MEGLLIVNARTDGIHTGHQVLIKAVHLPYALLRISFVFNVLLVVMFEAQHVLPELVLNSIVEQPLLNLQAHHYRVLPIVVLLPVLLHLFQVLYCRFSSGPFMLVPLVSDSQIPFQYSLRILTRKKRVLLLSEAVQRTSIGAIEGAAEV